jgi:hypothetical protein
MVLVVGEIPSEIRVTRDQYIGLLVRLDAATHSTSPTQVELAYDLIEELRTWFQKVKIARQVEDRKFGEVPEVDGQLELPLEWAETRAGR